MTAPGMKILGLDIETAPNTAHVWGLFKQTIHPNQLLQTGRVMCFAAKWFHDGASTIEFHSEFGGKHKKMVKAAWALLNEADAVVHYNGTKFDIPTLNREFLRYDLKPPAPYKQVDLLKTSRQVFRFASNRLDHLLVDLKIGQKIRHEGHEMWVKCMAGDAEAWAAMEQYNVGDVVEMEKLYHRMLPWITNHPNHALYVEGEMPVCTNCGGERLQRRGFAQTKTQEYRRYQCQDCGTWMREPRTALSPGRREKMRTQV